MCNSFEDRISWDGESLRQLVILNPEDRPGAQPGDLWRTLFDREAAMMSEAIREVLAEQTAPPPASRARP
jgi:hypothetical protein